MNDQFEAMLHTMSALDSVKPLNAETLLSDRPVSLFLDPALCPVCCDATVEKGEVCGECASLPVIDLTKRLDIVCEVEPYAPDTERYVAYDRISFDGDPESGWCIVGRGPTKRLAIRDLLTRLAEKDGQ